MLNTIDKLKKQLESIKTEIEKLSGFRDTTFLKKFRRQLEGEKSVILATISKLIESKQEKETHRLEKKSLANKNRSEKMKRVWRYLKAIQKNYQTNLSPKELRTALRKHRQGLETDIPDVAWRNPSP